MAAENSQMIDVLGHSCGGSGPRLWRHSRARFPKQFLCLNGRDGLFQQAAKRPEPLRTSEIGVSAPLIVSDEDHRFLAAEQLREIGIDVGAGLLKPVDRNTAPASRLAASVEAGNDPVLVVTPADHVTAGQQAFASAMHAASRDAEGGCIAILGITPDRPETDYGYLKIPTKTAPREPAGGDRFGEKPDAAGVKRCLVERDYLWNAGMLVLKGSVWRQALQTFKPEINQRCHAAPDKRRSDAAFVWPRKADFSGITADSIDSVVMEHSLRRQFRINMVRLDIGSTDRGAWDAVWDVHAKDADGNVHFADVISTNSARFKAKQIQVKPKASPSIQKHHYRAEHLAVPKGTAEIANGNSTLLPAETNPHVMRRGSVRRANPGVIPLAIVEVQSGTYLGKDDIIQFHDGLGRNLK